MQFSSTLDDSRKLSEWGCAQCTPYMRLLGLRVHGTWPKCWMGASSYDDGISLAWNVFFFSFYFSTCRHINQHFLVYKKPQDFVRFKVMRKREKKKLKMDSRTSSEEEEEQLRVVVVRSNGPSWMISRETISLLFIIIKIPNLFKFVFWIQNTRICSAIVWENIFQDLSVPRVGWWWSREGARAHFEAQKS